MTTIGQPLGPRSRFVPSSELGRRVLSSWVPAVLSLVAALGYGMFVAFRTYEVDLGVYLRLGGRYIFTPHLYSLAVPNTDLFFTYPPFAALLFAPWQRTFSTVHSVQAAWTLCNLAALIGLLVLSLRIVRPALGRAGAWRLGLALCLPALLLNPVVVTVGFGQVNLVVTLLVMWDLLTERRIGKWQAPLGAATGLAVAVKLTPILFVPYLLLTRRTRGALTCMGTFVACELLTFLVSPTSSTAYWTNVVFRPDRAGPLSFVGDQNLAAVLDRFNHGIVTHLVLVPLLIAFAAGGLWLAALAHRRSSAMLGLLVCAATGLVVSPITWVHHMVWVVPAILWLALAADRPRHGMALAIGTAVVFWSAPIWWVPFRNTSDLHLNGWQLVAGDAFFFSVLLFLIGAAVLVLHRPSRGVPDENQLLPGSV